MKYKAKPVIVEAWEILNDHPKSYNAEILDGAYGRLRPGEPATLRFGDRPTMEASSEMTARYYPKPGDYLVQQEDGYLYLNPKDVFERKYERI